MTPVLNVLVGEDPNFAGGSMGVSWEFDAASAKSPTQVLIDDHALPGFVYQYDRGMAFQCDTLPALESGSTHKVTVRSWNADLSASVETSVNHTFANSLCVVAPPATSPLVQKKRGK